MNSLIESEFNALQCTNYGFYAVKNIYITDLKLFNGGVHSSEIQSHVLDKDKAE